MPYFDDGFGVIGVVVVFGGGEGVVFAAPSVAASIS